MRFKEGQIVVLVKDIVSMGKSPWENYFNQPCVIKKALGFNNMYQQYEYIIDKLGPFPVVFCLEDELRELYVFKNLKFT